MSNQTQQEQEQDRIIHIKKRVMALSASYVTSAFTSIRKTVNPGIWIVRSETDESKWYRVMYNEDLDRITCQCKSYEIGSRNNGSEGYCKHIKLCLLLEAGVETVTAQEYKDLMATAATKKAAAKTTEGEGGQVTS